MPSWSVHLTIAKVVNEKLNLDKNLFYLGSLLPDISDGCNFVVANISKILS